MKKNDVNKVGRPKLADKGLKKESLLVSLFIITIIAIVVILGYNTLKIEFNSKYIVGTVYNTNINSCIIKDNMIKCGPNVTYMKYKIDDNDYNEISKDKSSIEVALDSYNKIKFCYKTNNTDLRCNK